MSLATSVRILLIVCVVAAAFGAPTARIRAESGSPECPCDPGEGHCPSGKPDVCSTDPSWMTCGPHSPGQDGCPADSECEFCWKDRKCDELVVQVCKSHDQPGIGFRDDAKCPAPDGKNKCCTLKFKKSPSGKWTCIDGASCVSGKGQVNRLKRCIEVVNSKAKSFGGSGHGEECVSVKNNCHGPFKSICVTCSHCNPCDGPSGPC